MGSIFAVSGHSKMNARMGTVTLNPDQRIIFISRCGQAAYSIFSNVLKDILLDIDLSLNEPQQNRRLRDAGFVVYTPSMREEAPDHLIQFKPRDYFFTGVKNITTPSSFRNLQIKATQVINQTSGQPVLRNGVRDLPQRLMPTNSSQDAYALLSNIIGNKSGTYVVSVCRMIEGVNYQVFGPSLPHYPHGYLAVTPSKNRITRYIALRPSRHFSNEVSASVGANRVRGSSRATATSATRRIRREQYAQNGLPEQVIGLIQRRASQRDFMNAMTHAHVNRLATLRSQMYNIYSLTLNKLRNFENVFQYIKANRSRSRPPRDPRLQQKRGRNNASGAGNSGNSWTMSEEEKNKKKSR